MLELQKGLDDNALCAVHIQSETLEQCAVGEKEGPGNK